MRAVVQRVTEARVEVDGVVVGDIDAGLVALLGVSKSDVPADAEYLAEKITGLRIFPDDAGKMNRSLMEAGGAILAVSQFTLYGDCRKGRRPSFDLAAPAEQARALYEHFVAALRRAGARVETGVFQAHMAVSLVNDGPVTLILESPDRNPNVPQSKRRMISATGPSPATRPRSKNTARVARATGERGVVRSDQEFGLAAGRSRAGGRVRAGRVDRERLSAHRAPELPAPSPARRRSPRAVSRRR